MEFQITSILKIIYRINKGGNNNNTKKPSKGIYYYTTYNNHQITAVDMFKENLDNGQIIRFPLIDNGEIRQQN